MDTRHQIERDYGYLKGRLRKVDAVFHAVRLAAFVAVDVCVLPIAWILEFCRWCFHKWTDVPIPNNLDTLTHGFTHIHLDTSNPKGLAVSDFELEQIVEYGLSAFGEHDIDAATRHRMVHRFATCCPRAFRFLTIEVIPSKKEHQGMSLLDAPRTASKVGYTCVLPLKKSGYDAYRRGELRDYDFSEYHILSPRYSRHPRYLCIQAFALCAHINRNQAKSLLEGIAYHLSIYVDEIFVRRPVLIAEAATASGAKLLNRFAFTRIGESANHAQMYELDTGQFDHLPERARHTITLLDAMMRKFRNYDDPIADGPLNSSRVPRSKR